MKIGFVGLGKLGMPCAVAMSIKGHDVMGYDVQKKVMNKKARPYRETGPDGILDLNPFLRKSAVRFGSLRQVARHGGIVFVAVQTPHDPEFEGITRLTGERKDFNYDYLIDAIKKLSSVIKRDTIVVIISTVLPGTIREKILPVINKQVKLCYNPFFIAMGTTMRDFLHPEFILFGVHDERATKKVESFYRTITDAPFYRTSIENAELIKVAYNTFIGMKIVFANTLMEICHKTPGADVDEVTNALKLATERLISGKYLSGGMGDGGGCHPRDNIAMSFLAQKLALSYDWFESVMKAREIQTEWLADLMEHYDLPKVILGKSFKPETNIVTGSPALLLKNILEERGHRVALYDPYIDKKKPAFKRSVFLIGTKHPGFLTFSFPRGSVVIDPWRYLPPDKKGVRVINVGIGV
jgi:UDPglucose 6-dehydrogenase